MNMGILFPILILVAIGLIAGGGTMVMLRRRRENKENG
ncbi:MAG: LPXTG cell wall anchor domain-containing protein [Planctomycetota bacterium]|jgi:LPXTG-motif cell wall-anchored protein